MGDSVQKGVHAHDLAADERWRLVERIAASSAFQKSARLRELLIYLAERTLHGHSGELTEQKIGHAVFSKPADYSPLEDSSVRVHVRQLRLRLHEYFDSVGESEPLIVEIPKGSYLPVFRSARQGRAEAGLAGGGNGRRLTFSRLAPWILCGVLALACAVLWHRLSTTRVSDAPQATAAPPWPLSEVIDAQHRTHVVVADVNYGMLRIISHKSGSLEEYLAPDFPNSFVPSKLSKDEGRIMNYISDSLLTSFADAATLTSLLQLSGPYRDRILVRSARDVKPRDLDEGNFIFLGSPGSNPWVHLFEDRLNFVETEGLVGEGRKAFQNKAPLPGEQKTYEGLRWTGTAGEDYAVIALLPNAEPKGTILILEGLQQEGTEAAGRFLADPANTRALRKALRLPADPKLKEGFEVLIRIRSVAGAPSYENICAARLIH